MEKKMWFWSWLRHVVFPCRETYLIVKIAIRVLVSSEFEYDMNDLNKRKV